MKIVNGLCAGGLWCVAMTGFAGAQDTSARPAGAPIRAVLELYTSQGCNSCPPADALLGVYAKRDDLVALTLPVDYWDYLGWKDTFASPKFTARQRAYAKERGDGRIYRDIRPLVRFGVSIVSSRGGIQGQGSHGLGGRGDPSSYLDETLAVLAEQKTLCRTVIGELTASGTSPIRVRS